MWWIPRIGLHECWVAAWVMLTKALSALSLPTFFPTIIISFPFFRNYTTYTTHTHEKENSCGCLKSLTLSADSISVRTKSTIVQNMHAAITAITLDKYAWFDGQHDGKTSDSHDRNAGWNSNPCRNY